MDFKLQNYETVIIQDITKGLSEDKFAHLLKDLPNSWQNAMWEDSEVVLFKLCSKSKWMTRWT